MDDGLALFVFSVLILLSGFLLWQIIDLQGQNSELNDTVTEFNATLKDVILNRSLLMPLGLDEHYEKIREDIGAKFIRKGDSGWLLFYATQVLHDLGNYTFGEYYSEYNFTVGTTCDKSLNIFTTEILDYVNETYPLVGGKCSETSKLQIAYEWVDYFISYLNDTKTGFGRFPTETLLYRYGDCEDQAMALAFLLENYGYDTALCMIHDENLTQYGKEGFYHTFCVVEDKNFNFNGTRITLNNYPEYGNNWLILDPAFDQKFGDNPEWANEYLIEGNTIQIPDEVWWDSLLIDYSAISARYNELGIDPNT